MTSTFLEFNRVNFRYFLILFVLLLAGWLFLFERFIFLEMVPITFIGIGVMYSGLFAAFDTAVRRRWRGATFEDFPRFLWLVYSFTLSIFLISVINVTIDVTQGTIGDYILSPSSWLVWAIVFGVPAFLVEKPQREHSVVWSNLMKN